ncbi:MAG: hypothetical protein JW953_10620 [Anaerolineae bacterium]|nr:hypothetical protein [Anaerolineae bacterium]
MIIPVFLLFVLSSLGGLAVGLYYQKTILLLALNILWWLGSFISAYFVCLAWLDRSYSENWAMLGFIFFSLPYILLTAIMLMLELFFTRQWPGDKTRQWLKWTATLLLIFLAFQLVGGFVSA